MLLFLSKIMTTIDAIDVDGIYELFINNYSRNEIGVKHAIEFISKKLNIYSQDIILDYLYGLVHVNYNFTIPLNDEPKVTKSVLEKQRTFTNYVKCV